MKPHGYAFEERPTLESLQYTVDRMQEELWKVEQILGKALDFPRYCDDQENFPGTTDADGVCVGDLTPGVLAQMAAERLRLMEGTTLVDYVNWQQERISR